MLGVGEILGGFIEGLFGDALGLEGFEFVLEGFLGRFGLGQGMLEFFGAIAGREVIGGARFAARDYRGVEFAAQPPAEQTKEQGGDAKEWEKFDDKPEVAWEDFCDHDGVVGWELLRMRGGDGLSWGRAQTTVGTFEGTEIFVRRE